MRKFTLLLLSSLLLSPAAFAQVPVGGISDPMTAAGDQALANFVQKWNIPAASYVASLHGKIIYEKAAGYADMDRTEPAQPHHLFRLGDFSMHLTSIAIMKMVENGQLNLTDVAFGSNGILKDHPFLSQATITDARINTITVYQLLNGTSGFWSGRPDCFPVPTTPYSTDGRVGGCQPLHVPLHVADKYGLDMVTPEAYIRYALELGLGFDPGQDADIYNGIDWLILGEIIEKISGKDYEEHVKTTILAPLGIYDMHIGTSNPEDKLEREVEYQGDDGTWLSSYDRTQTVRWDEGGWNLETQGPFAGWVGTARDLTKLLTAIDGSDTRPDILTPATINTMTAQVQTPFPNFNYAQGWWVGGQPGSRGGIGNTWWDFSQALTGSSGMLVRTAGGLIVTILTSRYPYGPDGEGISHNPFINELDALWAAIYNAATTNETLIPAYDLMLRPSTNSSDLTFSAPTTSSVTLNWANGNGERRMVIAKAGSAVSAFPLEGPTADYAANAAFGQGANLGEGNFVVYDGTESSVNVTGLDPSTTYHFRVVEYNDNANTGNHALYQLGGNPVAMMSTGTLTPLAKERGNHAIKVYPNPTSKDLYIDLSDLKGSADNAEITVYNHVGQQVYSGTFTDKSITLDTGKFARGLHIVKINAGGNLYVKRFLKN